VSGGWILFFNGTLKKLPGFAGAIYRDLKKQNNVLKKYYFDRT